MKLSHYIAALCGMVSHAAYAQSPTGARILPPPGSRLQNDINRSQSAPAPLPASTMNAAPMDPSPSSSSPQKMRLGLFIELSTGWLAAQPSILLVDYQPKTGITAEGKLFLSAPIGKITFDTGLGMFLYSVAGDEPALDEKNTPIKDTNGEPLVEEQRIFSFSTTFDSALSMDVGKNFLLGTTLQIRRPADLGYASTIVLNRTAYSLGGQIAYQRKGESTHHRIVLRVSRVLNNIDWTDLQAVIGYQLGLSLLDN